MLLRLMRLLHLLFLSYLNLCLEWNRHNFWNSFSTLCIMYRKFDPVGDDSFSSLCIMCRKFDAV